MFITRRSLPRRTVLRGLGTVVALPFLESMVPAMTALAQTPARPPLRFGAVYVPNGCPIPYWMPKGEAGPLALTPILQPLELFQRELTVIGQLSRAGGAGVTDHAVSSAGWLTGAVAKQTEAEDIQVGISIDQVLAQAIGQETPFPSLEYATEDFTGYIGGCGDDDGERPAGGRWRIWASTGARSAAWTFTHWPGDTCCAISPS